MTPMKLLVFYLFLCSTINANSQKSLRLIKRAELKIENGKYDKALKFLDRAESISYGFCGVSVIEAQQEIAFNKLRIYDFRHEDLKAANKLNELSYYFGRNLDSIKISYFIKAHGKGLVKKEIDSCLSNLNSIKFEDFYYEFPLNVLFSEKPFQLTSETMRILKISTYVNTDENKDIDPVIRFRNAVRNQPFYLLLI